MRVLFSLLAVVALATTAPAQIIKVEFKDPKKAKSFKNFCIEVNDQLYLVGEAKSGIGFVERNDGGRNLKFDPKTNELWVADMDNPRACPYKLQKGEKVKATSKASVTINGADIKDLSILIADQSLYGLSKEYARRDDEIADLRKQRDTAKKGTPEWKSKQTAVIQTMERMKSWLDETLYPRAAKKFSREIENEMRAAKEAMEQRLELAKQSIKIVPVPEDLAKIASEVYGDAIKFHMQESLHCRIIYREELGDDRVHGLLELAENMIDGFRVQFIDPFVGEDFKDYVLDATILEWYFGPDDRKLAEQFEAKYYGITIAADDPNRARRLELAHGTRRKDVQITAWKTDEGSDLEGMIAHFVGHRMVNLHYNQNRANSPADWLEEGVANWLGLEYLGRNSVQCVAFDVGKYAKPSKDNDEESGLLTGTADIYHRLALEQGPDIDQLALKQLAEFEDPHVAKAFSLFNFVAKTQGENGQRWLRSCCNAANVPGGFIPQWRKKSEEIYEVKGEDVFKKLDSEWRTYSEEQIGGPVAQ